jgi:hypothetical protein
MADYLSPLGTWVVYEFESPKLEGAIKEYKLLLHELIKNLV